MNTHNRKDNLEKLCQKINFLEETDFKNFKFSADLLNISVEKVILTQLLDRISRISTLLNSEKEPNLDDFSDLLSYSALLLLFRIEQDQIEELKNHMNRKAEWVILDKGPSKTSY
jgi:hypothetical protein